MMAINIDVEGRYTFYLKVPLRLEDVTGSDIARSSKFLRQINFIKCFWRKRVKNPNKHHNKKKELALENRKINIKERNLNELNITYHGNFPQR